MPRPDVPEVMKTRVEDLHEQHRGYDANTFQEALSTVLDLAEQAAREGAVDKKLPFQFDVKDTSEATILNFVPDPDSEIERTNKGLETEKAVIPDKRLYSELQEIDGVSAVNDVNDTMNVVFDQHSDRPVDEVVDDIFAVLAGVIYRGENRITQIEQRASQYASRTDLNDE